MPTEVKLPELGENISAGDLLKLLVKPGDKIKKDQALMELETDKAAIEVPSPVGGTVSQVHVKEGQKVKVGQLILSVDENGVGATKKEAGVVQAAPSQTDDAVAPKLEQSGAKGEVPKQAPAPKKAAAQASSPVAVLQFKLPELGENISSGDLVKLLIKPGDKVTNNQAVLELETDKATIEVPSNLEGTVKSVQVKEGDKVKVGQTIFTVEGRPGGAQVAEAESTGTGGIGTGGQIPQEQPIGEPTKRITEQPPTAAPRVDAVVPDWENEQLVPPAPDVPERVSPRTGKLPSDVAAAPSVRALAREIGVDITEVKGTGPHGRISVADVKAHARRRAHEFEKGTIGGRVIAAPLPDFTRWGAVERKPMTGIRRATAEHMQQAWMIPHVTNNDRANITELEQLRKVFAKRVEEQGGKLTMTAIGLKIVASALRKFPQFAASIDLANEQVIYKDFINIGVAVDTERGLLVPVIRDVDRKNIIEIAVELQQVAQRARDRKLKPEEMEGSVFTITNLGGIGGSSFTPIINSPEVAILGMMRSSMEPVYVDGKFEPRLMLPLSLSYDHRLIDGADAARFLRWLCEAFEQPFLLSLQG
ncbi:MAG TPA: dihydrolipoyllysine-residue acetyltransferase [Terriglobales bacterium]|nr:dihydrolipoyllysine-residue acetyltransferase [Terriglobales bacterium]